MNDRFLMHLESPPDSVDAVMAAYQRKMESLLLQMAQLLPRQLPSALSSLPVALLTNFAKVMGHYDESIRFFLGYLRRCGYNVSCGAGCHHCCWHMPYGVGVMELIYLYHGMRRHRNFSRIVRRFLERSECWSQLCDGREPGLGRDSSPERATARLLTDYQGLRQDCPLLEDGLCQVYRHRPFVCRMHFSRSPSSWCQPGYFQYEHAVRFNLEPAERVYRALAELDRRIGWQGSGSLMDAMLELTVNVFHFQPIEWIC